MDIEQVEIKQKLDLLGKKYPDILGSSINIREQKHHHITTHGPDTYGRFKSQFGTFFDLINKVLLGINYIKKDKWPKHRSLQYLLIQNNLISLRNSVELILNGYYSDSLVLARVNLEALIRCVWISCHPENSDSGILDIKSKIKFNYTNFVNDDLKLDWVDHKMWSLGVHANQYATIKDWVAVHKKEKEYPICLELKYDKEMIELCINSIIYLELFNLKLVIDILVTDFHKEYLSPELINDANEFISCYEKMIRSHPKKYWPKIPDDLIDLMVLVKEMDLSKEKINFKEKWLEIKERHV